MAPCGRWVEGGCQTGEGQGSTGIDGPRPRAARRCTEVARHNRRRLGDGPVTKWEGRGGEAGRARQPSIKSRGGVGQSGDPGGPASRPPVLSPAVPPAPDHPLIEAAADRPCLASAIRTARPLVGAPGVPYPSAPSGGGGVDERCVCVGALRGGADRK